MNFSNLGEIKAVAFDIDGTLYDERPFNKIVFPYVLRHVNTFFNYWRTRRHMHSTDEYDEFYSYQAKVMGKNLHCSPEKANQKIKDILHYGLEPIFGQLQACDGVLDLIKRLKQSGLKIALLSDLPTEQKGDIWGIRPFSDVVICSEVSGAIKPSKKPFLLISNMLGIKPEEILYIGNNYKYDILGAKAANMKTGWFAYHPKNARKRKHSVADITFTEYSQLENFLYK